MGWNVRGAMTCRHAERQIAPLADGATADADCVRHVNACLACERQLQQQREVVRLLATMGSDPAPGDFASLVRARIDSRTSWLDIADWKLWTLRLAPLAVGLAIVAALFTRTRTTPLTLDDLLQQWSPDRDRSRSAMFAGGTSSDMLLYELIGGQAPHDDRSRPGPDR